MKVQTNSMQENEGSLVFDVKKTRSGGQYTYIALLPGFFDWTFFITLALRLRQVETR